MIFGRQKKVRKKQPLHTHLFHQDLVISKKSSNFVVDMKRIAVFLFSCMLLQAGYADEILTGTSLSGNGWRGLDLGTPHVITSVGWNPLSTTTAELGIFEGANSPDFLDAIPLYMHDGASVANQMNGRYPVVYA